MTREEAENICGICVKCGEHTTVAESCCGAGISAEGHIYHEEDIEDEGEDT